MDKVEERRQVLSEILVKLEEAQTENKRLLQVVDDHKDLLKRFYEAMAMSLLDAAAKHGPDFNLKEHQQAVITEVKELLHKEYPEDT